MVARTDLEAWSGENVQRQVSFSFFLIQNFSGFLFGAVFLIYSGGLMKKKNKDGSPKKFTDCKCPKCEKEHKRRLYWTGKLPAPKYCWHCDKVVQNQSTGITPINLIIAHRDIDFHLSKRERSDDGH
jgi:hypothetical protein